VNVRRSRADWLLDTAAFAFAVVFGGASLASGAATADLSTALLLADAIAGSLACLALWLRRRWPVGVALAIAPVAAFSTMASGAALVAVFGVAVRRPLRTVVPVAALFIAVLPIYFTIRLDEETPEVGNGLELLVAAVVTVAVVLWGMYIRTRHQLVAALAERAERIEAEHRERLAQARRAERTRIAREMHDVLAHRLSLLSLHAGALEYSQTRSGVPDELARSAGVIRDSAHGALEDLRAVIGLLRDDGAEAPAQPQPTLVELPELIAESQRAGMRLDAELAVDDLAAVPAPVALHAYRILQEGLTNARKHAGRAAVALRVAGGAGDGLEIELRNRLPDGAAAGSAPPGAGAGLVGLAERAALADGRLEHGPTADGDFRLWAWLPWRP
jgi:signal transduction histidine kinase